MLTLTLSYAGFFEAAVTPGLSLMTGFYYMRSEAPLRQTIWYSSVGWGGMIGSLMAAGIEKANQNSLKVPKWELIFIVLGAITIAWGAVLFFFLADGPSNAFWLRPEQRTLAVARVAQGGVGIKSRKFKTEQMWEALVDPKAWCLTIAMFGSSVPNGILVRSSSFPFRCVCAKRRLTFPRTRCAQTNFSGTIVSFSRSSSSLFHT